MRSKQKRRCSYPSEITEEGFVILDVVIFMNVSDVKSIHVIALPKWVYLNVVLLPSTGYRGCRLQYE